MLAGLIGALRFVGGSLANHRFLFLGAGEVRLGLLLSVKSILSIVFLDHFLCDVGWHRNS